MRIQYVNSYSTYHNFPKAINKKGGQSGNAQNSIKLPSPVYTPFFGMNNNSPNNAHNIVINKILNNKEYPNHLKQYLNKLLKIKDFEAAAMAVNIQEMHELISVGYFLSPVFEEVLKGEYVASFPNSNIEKPLIDLKAIADYNKKHIEKPLNLFEQINENPLAGIFCNVMQQNKLTKLDKPYNLSYADNNETYETTIKYKPAPKISFTEALKELSEEDINNLENADFSPEMREFLQSKYMNKDLQKLLWEMSEIPFFTAAAQNCTMEDLVDILEDIDYLKPLSIEAFKGNIIIKNTKTKKEEPIINLAQIAINNKLNPENQRYLFDELCENKLYTNIIDVINKFYNNRRKIPDYFVSLDKHGNSLGILWYKNNSGKTINMTAEELKAAINNGLLKQHIPYIILFENDLNKIIENEQLKSAPIKNENTNIDNIRKFTPMPEGVKQFLSNPKNNNEYKRIIYELGETPYFYSAIKNVPESTIKNIVYLKAEYPDIFDKIISGKLVIIESKDPKKLNALVNIKALASSQKPPENLFSINSFESNICEDLVKIKKIYKDNPIALNYGLFKNETAYCKLFVANDKTVETQFINLPVADSIKKYLLSLPTKNFSVVSLPEKYENL